MTPAAKAWARASAILVLAACGGSKLTPVVSGDGGVSCGPGTFLSGTECVPAATVTCGAGTRESNGQCLPTSNVSCGSGTILLGTQCIPAGSLTCGPGTFQSGSECLPTGNPVSCGPGTFLSGTQCVPSGNSVTCGPGTVLVGGECDLADGGVGLSCGPGTVQLGNQCVVAPPDDAGTPSDAGANRSEAPSFGIDPAHTNAQPGDTVGSPLVPRWIVKLTGLANYPLVAQGRVIFSADEAQPNVRAVDASTGALLWGPIVFGGPVMIAYDQGRVFALDGSGHLAAMDATNGHPLWNVSLQGQIFFDSPPVASGGLVYIDGLESGGTTYAVSESTGAVVWTANTFDGSDGTVAVAGGRVYEAEACDQLSAFDAASGVLDWFHAGNCTGGGGSAPSVYSGLIWERDWASGNAIINSAGQSAGAFTAQYLPAFHNQVAFYTAANTVSAVDLTNNTLKWSFTGDGMICTSAVVAGAGGQVFAGSASGNVYEIDEATGMQRSVSDAGSPVSCGSEKQALALAAGHLFVPAGNSLVAF